MAEAFPLQWPEGWKRTLPHLRQRARYKLTPDAAASHLLHELELLGAFRSSVVISTNIPVRRDGLPYAQARMPEDPGVAVYWSTKAFKDRSIACDKWDRLHDNIHACGLAVGAMRAIDRAGASQILERVFSAFGALPPAAEVVPVRAWWDVLGFPEQLIGALSAGVTDARYRELASKVHPDRGGSDAAMSELNRARDEARLHYGGP